MRHRPLRNPDRALAAAADPHPLPGRASTLTLDDRAHEIFDWVASGDRPRALRELRRLVAGENIESGSFAVAALVARLIQSQAGAVHAFALGLIQDVTPEAIATCVGMRPGNFRRAVERARKKLQPASLQTERFRDVGPLVEDS